MFKIVYLIVTLIHNIISNDVCVKITKFLKIHQSALRTIGTSCMVQHTQDGQMWYAREMELQLPGNRD